MVKNIETTKLDGIKVGEANVITAINGVNVEDMNEIERRKEESNKAKKHSFRKDILNYNILFMMLGLGLGLIFGKFFPSNIAIIACSGTLIGLFVGIVYTEALINKKKKEKEKE